MLLSRYKMSKVHIAWTLGLAIALAFFLLGYSIGYMGNEAQSFSSMKFLYSQSITTLEPHSIDSSHSRKQKGPLHHGDEGGISMHTVFMSGCDKWQVSNHLVRYQSSTILSVCLPCNWSLYFLMWLQDWEAIGLYWSFLR